MQNEITKGLQGLSDGSGLTLVSDLPMTKELYNTARSIDPRGIANRLLMLASDNYPHTARYLTMVTDQEILRSVEELALLRNKRTSAEPRYQILSKFIDSIPEAIRTQLYSAGDLLASRGRLKDEDWRFLKDNSLPYSHLNAQQQSLINTACTNVYFETRLNFIPLWKRILTASRDNTLGIEVLHTDSDPVQAVLIAGDVSRIELKLVAPIGRPDLLIVDSLNQIIATSLGGPVVTPAPPLPLDTKTPVPEMVFNIRVDRFQKMSGIRFPGYMQAKPFSLYMPSKMRSLPASVVNETVRMLNLRVDSIGGQRFAVQDRKRDDKIRNLPGILASLVPSPILKTYRALYENLLTTTKGIDPQSQRDRNRVRDHAYNLLLFSCGTIIQRELSGPLTRTSRIAYQSLSDVGKNSVMTLLFLVTHKQLLLDAVTRGPSFLDNIERSRIYGRLQSLENGERFLNIDFLLDLPDGLRQGPGLSVRLRSSER